VELSDLQKEYDENKQDYLACYLLTAISEITRLREIRANWMVGWGKQKTENATLRQAVQAAIDYFTDGITSKEQYDAYLKFVDAAQPFFEEHEVEP